LNNKGKEAESLKDKSYAEFVNRPYRTIDLCAGIGGIRKGFELTGDFLNVFAVENDKYACQTYEFLFGDNPYGDLTSEATKTKIRNIQYEILMAGFPCQTFSRMGLEEGFKDKEKGQIFFHLVSIIKDTRPLAIFLENVDNLTTHNKGKTFKYILETLVSTLDYHVIGVSQNSDGSLEYDPKSFIRNSKDFGIPQNRPRAYIIGFDKKRFTSKRIELLPSLMPFKRNTPIYRNLNDILDDDVDLSYYLASNYLNNLVKHKEKQKMKGYGFGYRIVNEPRIRNPIANTILATGGSGKERNLIYDPKPNIAGQKIKGKKSPLNSKGIRIMTPNEWGKLQGFVNYAFLENNKIDKFSFPESISNTQKYKQLGNAVTIPVIEEMAKFISHCLCMLQQNNPSKEKKEKPEK